MRIALCPGSYDPVTKGHLDIIERASALFDKIIVVVMLNPAKKTAFTVTERVAMLQQALAGRHNIEVTSHEGLVAEFAGKRGACALVKGLRAVTDFEYEFQMSLINKKLNPQLETLFITTRQEYMYLSSSAVREIASFGGDLSEFVPPELEQTILNRLHKPAETEDVK